MKQRITEEDCVNGFNRLKAQRGVVGIDGGEVYKEFMFMKLHGFNILIKALCEIPEMPEDVIGWMKRDYLKRRNYYVQQENKKPLSEAPAQYTDPSGYRFLNLITDTIKALSVENYYILWTEINEGWTKACGDKQMENEALDKGEAAFKGLLKKEKETLVVEEI